MTVENLEEFDKLLAIHQSFSHQSFLNAFPLKPTSNLLKFCSSKFCEWFIHQRFSLSNFCAIQYIFIIVFIYCIYVASYAHNYDIHIANYTIVIFSLFQILATSVTNAVSILNAPNATNELYSITVTCTVHPNSDADQCVVMAMADGKLNTTGAYIGIVATSV